MTVYDLNGAMKPVHKFPYRLNNGLLLLRFTEPSQIHPAGRLYLNNPAARENYVAEPHVLGMTIG